MLTIGVDHAARQIAETWRKYEYAIIVAKMLLCPQYVHIGKATARLPRIDAPFFIVDTAHRIKRIPCLLITPRSECHPSKMVHKGIFHENLSPPRPAKQR